MDNDEPMTPAFGAATADPNGSEAAAILLMMLGDAEAAEILSYLEPHEVQHLGSAMFGVGYEWWVSDQWSVGVLGRMALAWTTGKDTADVRWYHTIGASPSILFTATFN